jgi:hypothetical protein
MLHYDPETGIFTNLTDRHHAARKGEIAGSRTALGYIEIGLLGERFLAHRLAWLYVHGRWPDGEIDHRDGARSNNRLKNLRDVPHEHNQQNIRMPVAKSGLPGAYQVGERFKALIRVGGKSRHLGYFDTAEAAHSAYVEAKRKFHAGSTL